MIPGLGRSIGEGIGYPLQYSWGFPCGSADKESAHNAGDLGVIPGSERSPGEWKGDVLQYSCWESSVGRGAWRATYKYYLRIVTIVQASLIVQLVKNPPAVQETPVRFLGREDLLEKGEAIHSSILWLPLGLSWQRIHLQCGRPGFDSWVGKIPWRRERLPIPVFWSGEFHGLSMGLQRVRHD